MKKEKKQMNKKEFEFLIIVITTLFVAYLFFIFGFTAYSNHQEYKLCKSMEDMYKEDFECSYFGEKNYDVYHLHRKNLHWDFTLSGRMTQSYYKIINLLKNCNQTGDILYETESTKDVKTVACLNKDGYNILLINLNKTVVNLTINTKKNIPYFKNYENNKTYLINNGSFNIIMKPYEVVVLNYNPREFITAGWHDVYNYSKNPLDKFKSIGNFTIYNDSFKLEIPQEFFYALENKSGCFRYKDYKICNKNELVIINPSELLSKWAYENNVTIFWAKDL